VALRTVGVRLTAEIGEYQSKLRAAAQTTRDFKGELDKASKKGNLDKVADQAAIVGTGLLGMAAVAVKSAADFDKAMSAVSAATHAPKAEMDQLRAAALQAGKDTMYSATQAADGVTELAKAGVSTANILGGGLKGALSLAAAGQLDVGEAAETAASAMTQFNLSGDQVPHIADLLAAAAGKAQGSVHDMGAALNQSGLVAAQFGLSIEDTTGALAEFANAGLTGSDAGTSLKTMLLAIANPSKQTKTLMDDLGISFYDTTGKFIGFNGVAQVLQTRLKGLTDAQRQQALGQIFGNDAIRSASILYADGAAGVDKWRKAVNDSGYAADTAAKLTDNLSGDLERLKGSLETMFIEAGGGANGGLRFLVKALNGIADVLADLPSGLTGALTVLAALSGAALLTAAAFVKTRKTIAEVNTELTSMGPAGEKAAAGVGRVSGAVSKAAGFFAIWASAMAAADAIANKQQTNVDALTVGLTKFGQGAELSGESARVLGSNLDNLKTGFKFLADDSNSRLQFAAKLQKGLESTIPGLKDYNTSLSNTQAQIDSVDAALAGMVTSGHASDAAATFNRLASVLAVDGVSMDEFKKKFPSYEAALESSGKATSGATGKLGDLSSALQVGKDAQSKYKTEADAVAGAARGEREAIGALYAEIKGQTDPVFALIDAQKKLKDAQKSYTDAVKAHGKKSAEARAADLGLAQAALGLQNATGNLSSTFNGKLGPAFVATLKAAGLTKGQIADVAKQFEGAKRSADKYTGKYAADVSAPGAKKAKTDLDNAYTAANHFAGPYIADLRVTGQGKVEAAFRKLSEQQQALKSGHTLALHGHGFAAGGYTGSGPKFEPAGVVHRDEYVIKKESRQKIESARPGLLDAMNAGHVPGYAGGGHVLPFPVTAAMTKIPTEAQALSKLLGGGPGYKWMEAIVRAAFPGMPVYSDYRPGAITITGNRSYHGFGRAVDFAPSKPLAEWINLHYMAQTKELITPWQSLNIQNGHRHAYSALVENQHNFAGGNAHDHWAMKNGGTITEPIFGVGVSGRTYSFGENYQAERVTPMWQAGGHGGGAGTEVHIHFSGPVGSQYELKQWLTGAVDDLKRAGRI
jgi:TP901 family phage tail tape measure protein